MQMKIGFFQSSVAVLFLSACGQSGQESVNLIDQIKVSEQFLEAGQPERAFGMLEGIAQSNENSSATQIQIGNAYMRSGALLRANEAFAKAAHNGAVDEANIGFGSVALKRNDPDTAHAYFTSVLERDSRNVDALNGLGVAYDLQGNHALAQEMYRTALGIRSDAFKALNNLGLSMMLSGNSAGAVSVLSELTESRLDSRTSRLNLAVALSRIGRDADAMRLATSDITTEDATALFEAVDSYMRQQS